MMFPVQALYHMLVMMTPSPRAPPEVQVHVSLGIIKRSDYSFSENIEANVKSKLSGGPNSDQSSSKALPVDLPLPLQCKVPQNRFNDI